MNSPPFGVITVSFLLIVSLIAIMVMRGGRLSEARLIALGVMMALGAVLFDVAMASPEPSQRIAIPDVFVTGKATTILSKIGLVLVLGGVVGYLWKSSAPAAEGPRHEA